MTMRILTGDCREVLRTLPSESVHCCVTSPPYYGLRDYGTATWEGGDPNCDHSGRKNRNHQGNIGSRNEKGDAFRNSGRYVDQGNATGRQCKCGARRIDSQLGLEPDFNDYIAQMVEVFREVRRVLRRDGTLWLNMGDSYASQGGYRDYGSHDNYVGRGPTGGQRPLPTNNLKPKDLCGIPWRLAFALQADGWWLRQDIIWSKPNPMPESVTDRCTKAHEYIFLLSKSARYYYDAGAIKEDGAESSCTRAGILRKIAPKDSKRPGSENGQSRLEVGSIIGEYGGTRNKRSVWEIATAPFSEAHFATFPPALIEPCIKAGTSEKGCCAKCGAPWVRNVSKKFVLDHEVALTERHVNADDNDQGSNRYKDGHQPGRYLSDTIDWSPSCSCNADVVPAAVLDCFGGAGTTGLVADRLQRNAILIELNPEYAAMAERRIHDDAPLFAMAAE